MGNYACRKGKMIPGWQIDIAERVFRGESDKEIAIHVLGADTSDPKDMKNKIHRVRNVFRNESWQAYYKSIVTEWTVHNVGRALTKLSEQIDSSMPWLANKAANDVLQRVPKSMLVDEEAENTIKVVVEGMPELGMPAPEASDAEG